MRIAIEGSTWINPRGYGRFTREMTRALIRASCSHEFTLVLDSGASRASDLPDLPTVTVQTGRAVVEAATSDGSRSPLDVWRMSRALSSSRFDAVIFPTLYSFVPVRRGPHVTVIIHDALPEALPQLVLGGLRARMFWQVKRRLACRRADLLATVSQASAREIRTRLRVGSRPLAVLTEGFSPIFSAVPTPDDADLVQTAVGRPGRVILYVGGLSPHKRVPALVRAFKHVASNSGRSDVLLVLAGPHDRDGFFADDSELRHALDELGPIAERVVRTGYVSDPTLAALYRAATCLVLPSALEGFGLPAVEAMASGTPVIAARTAALEEVCGDAAVYVDQPGELAAAVARVVDDGLLRQHLSRAGLGRSTAFGWDQAARLLLRAVQHSVDRAERGAC